MEEFNLETYDQKLNRILTKFTGKYLSNAKWHKLLLTLSENDQLVRKCYLKTIWPNEGLSILKIPSISEFNKAFNQTGINDGWLLGGPIDFKEIQWIEFPHSWEIERNARDQNLEPFVYEQNTDEIYRLLRKTGMLEVEMDPESLKIYAYK